MSKAEGRIVVVDDDESMCDLLGAALRRQGMDVLTFTHPQEALDAFGDADVDAVITDVGMTEMSGFALCERIVGMRPGLPVIVLTGQGTMEAAVTAMRVGAYDFLTKPVDTKVLALSVGRAVQHHRLQDELTRLRSVVAEGKKPRSIVGSGLQMRRVYDLIERVAPGDASVLIYGETGTGKELIARAIHEASPRSERPFVAINCAAVPANLIESELFGHARGAFTDAKTQRTGLFVQANGGTLFLDEIGELPLDMQPKLLRALQERKVRPVGSNAEIPFDARIVAATNRDLESEVFHKRFREDLYYRVNVVQVDLPPLRSRAQDVLELAAHFLAEFSRKAGREKPLVLSSGAAEKIMQYEWPGNVRELENSMERAVALARFEELTVEDLPDRIRAYKPNHFVIEADDASEVVSLHELERRYIERVLKLVGDNKSRAAQILGVDRRTLYRKLERFEEEKGHQAQGTTAQSGVAQSAPPPPAVGGSMPPREAAPEVPDASAPYAEGA
ncbi:MAG: sigma-54 dependent transcriptional regulator [Polyangiaceae bacterium]